MTRIVVLGGGFAGLETIRCLEGEPRHILQPILDIRGARRFRFRRDRVTGIDLAAREATLVEGTIGYDRLVIVLGGATPTFGVPGAKEWALGYRKLVGFRKQIQGAIDRWLARHFPRDSAIMREPRRCPVCMHSGRSVEHRAA